MSFVSRAFPRKNTDKLLKHLFDGSDWNVYNKSVVNLGVGAPGPDILTKCCEIFEQATSHRMKKESENQAFMFQYGPPNGPVEARIEISKFLTDAYQSEVKAEDIIMTTGASQGLNVILPSLIDLNGFMFVDELTFMIVLGLVKQYPSLTIIPVKLCAEGVDLNVLTAILHEKKFVSETKQYWGMYYAIPTFHNPTGIAFTNENMRDLVTIARDFDILVVCDDVYNTLTYVGDQPKRLYELDNPEDEEFKCNVISNGSFSKIIAPGLRLGWLEARPRCKITIEETSFFRSGGCPNNYSANIMASLLELGLAQDQYISTKGVYSERMLASIETLKEHLPSSCTFAETRGGYFIWITMPDNADSNELLKICLSKYKIFFFPGNTFSMNNDFKHCLRISIAFLPKEDLVNACVSICEAMTEYLEYIPNTD